MAPRYTADTPAGKKRREPYRGDEEARFSVGDVDSFKRRIGHSIELLSGAVCLRLLHGRLISRTVACAEHIGKAIRAGREPRITSLELSPHRYFANRFHRDSYELSVDVYCVYNIDSFFFKDVSYLRKFTFQKRIDILFFNPVRNR